MQPLEQAHAALGATWTQVAGVPVPRHYGAPEAEYRAVREGVGVVHRADQAQLRMWGRDPVRMLHGLVTNDVSGAAPGQGVYATMLTPKGRVISELRAFTLPRPDGVQVLVDVPRESLAEASEHLKKFVPPMFARFKDVSEEVGVVGAYGPRSRELVERALGGETLPLEEDRFVEVQFGSEPVLVVGTRYAGGEEGYDLFAAAPALPSLWDGLLAQGGDLGARPVGQGALETLRIEAGRPRGGWELTGETIPTEAFEAVGLMPRAISFTKGCYTGQEVIVRIAHRGHVNRHLRGLRLGDLPAPGPGTPLFHPDTGKEVGRATSAAFSPRLGQTVALGFVRREVQPGERLALAEPGGAAVEVASLPFTPEAADGAE